MVIQKYAINRIRPPLTINARYHTHHHQMDVFISVITAVRQITGVR